MCDMDGRRQAREVSGWEDERTNGCESCASGECARKGVGRAGELAVTPDTVENVGERTLDR